MKNSSNILVCPLDWGIGHAARCVPVIHELLRQHANVIIAADGRPLAFLKIEFPDLQFIQFPGYKFSYPGNGSMALKMALQIPRILKGIRKEKQLLDEIITTFKIDGVISDNRYGLSSENVPCIFITHQLKIKVPRYLAFLQPLLYRYNRHFISKFDECWVPDFIDEPNLSGELSHINPLPDGTYFIGPLSRFNQITGDELLPENNEQFKYDLLVLLSGPEPQRTILEESILSQLKSGKYSAIVISGKPESIQDVSLDGHIKIYPHLDSKRLRQAILESRIVLSRPGYSTLMDLAVLGKKAVFIPTPGQTEQEYLANYCLEKRWFYSMSQKKIDLDVALEKAGEYSGFKITNDGRVLSERILAFMNRVKT